MLPHGRPHPRLVARGAFQQYHSPAERPPRVVVPTRTCYTDSVATSTAWTRSPRTQTAVRGTGKETHTLSRQDGMWVLRLPGGVELYLDAGGEPDLDTAIEQCDLVSPPEGWTPESSDRWTREGWACVRLENCWVVEHPRGRMQQKFASCDRARKWVDLRIDRPGGLRGPRLRSSTPAARTLPDVRVTEAERARAINLAQGLGMTFADFLRSSIRVMDELHKEGALSVRIVSGGKEVAISTTARNVHATYVE